MSWRLQRDETRDATDMILKEQCLLHLMLKLIQTPTPVISLICILILCYGSSSTSYPVQLFSHMWIASKTSSDRPGIVCRSHQPTQLLLFVDDTPASGRLCCGCCLCPELPQNNSDVASSTLETIHPQFDWTFLLFQEASLSVSTIISYLSTAYKTRSCLPQKEMKPTWNPLNSYLKIQVTGALRSWPAAKQVEAPWPPAAHGPPPGSQRPSEGWHRLGGCKSLERPPNREGEREREREILLAGC